MKVTGYSVVIRTKNEERFLPDVLQMVQAQQVDGPVEIIVVDSGSTDKTLTIVKQFGAVIIEIPPRKFTWGYALNIGIEKATYEHVVLLSAHAIPANEYWLHHLSAPMNDPEVAGVFGRQIPNGTFDPFEEVELIKAFPDGKEPVPSTTFSNANCLIRKIVWKKVKMDETLMIAEDGKWALDVIRLGKKIMYAPKAVVLHSHDLKNILNFDETGSMYLRNYWRSYVCAEILTNYSVSGIRRVIRLWKNFVKQDFLLLRHKKLHRLSIIPFYELIRVYAIWRGAHDFKKDAQANRIARMSVHPFSKVPAPFFIKLNGKIIQFLS